MNWKTSLKKLLKRMLPKDFLYSVARVSLNTKMIPLFKRLERGIVLDVGAGNSPYRGLIPCKKYLSLDINKNHKPDIVSDVQKIEWESEYFDTVIATETLEHVCNPQKAINEIHRILKPNGVCIVSVPFSYRYHPNPKDYYRFTWDSLKRLFRRFSKVEIYHHGSKFHVIWQMISESFFPLRVFNPIIGRIQVKTTSYPCGFIVFARK